MTTDELRGKVSELGRSAWALTALTVAAERGLLRAMAGGTTSIEELASVARLAPNTVTAIADVLAALGFCQRAGTAVTLEEAARALVGVAGPDLFAADLTSTLGSIAGAAIASRSAQAVEGWRADDEAVIRAQAVISQSVTERMVGMFGMLPELDGALRAEGARFLDVGVGGAGLSIGLCRLIPALHVVGIEPAPVAVREARHAVHLAGLDTRIEIREQLGEALGEEAAFDVAYVAQMFIPDAVVGEVLQRTRRALRPGGWLLTGATALPGADLPAAVSRWRSAVWGGGTRSPAEVTALLDAAGFTAVMAMPAPPGNMVPLLARIPT